jgi:hypothetical protein
VRLGMDGNFAAISKELYGQLGKSYICGRNIIVTAPNGRTATVPVLDMCPGCVQYGGTGTIDLSLSVFQSLGYAGSVGRVYGVTWRFA